MQGLPERSGLGQAGMLTSTGFVFHEYSSNSGIHPCGAELGQACWCSVESGIWSYIHTGIPLNICWSLSHERHRSHTCPDGDPLQVRITQVLTRSQSSPLHRAAAASRDVVEYAARFVAV